MSVWHEGKDDCTYNKLQEHECKEKVLKILNSKYMPYTIPQILSGYK